MSLKRWILLAFIALVVYGVVVAAQDDDDEPADSAAGGQPIQEVNDGVDAEEAAEEIANDDSADDKEDGSISGLKAFAYFPTHADLKVPAGERIEMVLPIVNAPGNPSYEAHLIAGHIALLDHSRYIQNFSAQVYARTVVAGETTSVKYSVTPDAMLDPMEYAFVVTIYMRTDSNQTIVLPAFNGTMVVVDPLGFDFQGLFTVVGFFGSIGGAGYYFWNKRQAARPVTRRAAAPVETGTGKNTAYDPEFVDKEHLAYVTKSSSRNRSASK